MGEEQTLVQLVESLRREQCRQWEAGERVPVEEYFRQHPELGADAERALELIYNEVVLRQRGGDAPRLDQYQERFPNLATRLELLFEVHCFLEAAAGSAADTPTTSAAGPEPASTGELPAVPGFEVLREVGRGGMSVVYEARQLGLNRKVALKMLLAGGYAGREQRTRFRTEGEALGRLQHPHIVPVHGVGEHDGRLYLVMEYVEGGNLAEAVARGQWAGGGKDGQQRAARLVETLARAVHYAHQRGIVHRDLKPANILLASGGREPPESPQRLSSGGLRPPLAGTTPKITDFGLAKLLEREGGNAIAGGPTQSGAVLGTPSYMAPEQAAGQSREIGPAADVYALGTILYELLAGRPPFRAETPLQALLQVQSAEPVPPGRLCPRLSRDLATVCLKCLEKDPRRRYPSAEALADDLGRFLAGEPIQARPVGAPERAWRWCRRNPLAASLAGALGLIVLGSLVGLTGLYLNADAQRRRAEGAEERWQKAADEARQEEKKARQSEAQTKTVLEFFQKRVMAAARPKGQQGGLGADVTMRAAVEQAEPGIARAFAGQPLVEASIRQVLGHTYWFWGEYPQAIRQHQRALALRRAQLGPDHPETMKSMASLAQDYEAAGRQADALRLYRETLKLRQARSGPDDPETLWSMKGVADALVFAGRVEEALPVYEEALRRASTALEPDHADTLIYMDKLANTYRLVGRFDEAVSLFKDTLKRERARAGLGPNHPNTLVTMNNLAVAYSAAGRYDEAAALFRETLTRMKAEFGPEHRETLNSLTNLGKTYREAGRLAEALPLLEKALKGKTTRLGPDHYLTLISMGELATAYQMDGRLTEALSLFKRTLRLQKAKLGADSPWRLTCMNQTGACLIRMKKFGEAEALLRDCLALRTRKHPDGWEVFHTRSQLGQALTGLKRYADAETLLREAHRELAARKGKIPVPFRCFIREAAQALVDLYQAWGKKERAAKWRQVLAVPSPAKP
jgi:serine/threonine protein kinase